MVHGVQAQRAVIFIATPGEKKIKLRRSGILPTFEADVAPKELKR
jgi:hypothetical protein